MDITKTLIRGNERLNFLPKMLGNKFSIFESTIYNLMDHYNPAYHGGYWDFYKLSNGGFYIELSTDKPIILSFPENHFEETLSPEGASVAINIMALNHLAWKFEAALFIDFQDKLKDFSGLLVDAPKIWRFLD